MRGGAFVVWCKRPGKLCNGSQTAARFHSPSSRELHPPLPATLESFPEPLYHTTKAPPRMRMSLNAEEAAHSK